MIQQGRTSELAKPHLLGDRESESSEESLCTKYAFPGGDQDKAASPFTVLTGIVSPVGGNFPELLEEKE